jgi:hypothetical protein
MDANTTTTNVTTLEQSLVAIINKASEGVDTGVSFLSVQLPDVVHQLLTWKMLESVSYNLLAIVLIVLMIKSFKYIGKGDRIHGEYCNYYKETLTHNHDGDTDGRIVITTSGYLLISASALHYLNLTWLQIWVAPKIFLIEYASSLVK